MKSWQSSALIQGFLGALAAAVLTVAPVAMVRGSFLEIAAQWQEAAFYLTAIASSGLSSALGFRLSPGERELSRQRAVVWGGAIFLFLYVASAALCQRLGMGAADFPAFRTAGFILVLLGAALRLWAISVLGPFHSALVAVQPDHKLVTSGPYRWLRHPSYLGVLLGATGLPMVFGAWFPLVGVPGVFVALKWRIRDEEEFLEDEFEDEYRRYREQTWHLLPFIY